MQYEINEIIEFNNKEFQVVADISLEESRKKKSIFLANALSILLFVIVAAAGFFAIRFIHPPMCFRVTVWSFLILIGGYAVYLFVHELLRGLVFILPGGVQPKDLLFGVEIRQGTVYCISKAPIKLRRVRTALLLPFFLVFVPLAVLGLYYGDIVLILAAALAITISAADFYFLHRLRKHSGSLYLLEERPDKAREDLGGYILREIVSVNKIETEQV